MLSSGKEIVIFVGGKVGFGVCLAAERFAVTDFLQVVQSAGNAAVPVAVESIKVDGSSAVDTAVNFGVRQNFVAVGIDDTGGGGGVGVDKVGICVCGVIGPFGISVTERFFDCRERGNASAVAFQFGFAFLIRRFDGSLDFGNRYGIGFGNDEGDGILGCAAVDGFGFPYIA